VIFLSTVTPTPQTVTRLPSKVNGDVKFISGATMKKLLLTSAALAALLTSPAVAADQAARVYKRARPVVVAAPVYSWTGFYVGGNLGYSWGDARTDIAGGEQTISHLIQFTNPPTTFGISHTQQRLNGVIGGGQIGYNFQFSPRWVLGFEADIQGSAERGGAIQSLNPFSGIDCNAVIIIGGNCVQFFPVNGTAATAYDAKISWFGTVRGRLGFLISDQVLLYGTGGLAYGRVELSGITNVNGSFLVPGVGTFPFATPGTTTFSTSSTRTGFAVGGGIEGKFSYWLPPDWTWKLEYLYIDLGSIDTVAAVSGAILNPTFNLFTGAITTHTHFTDNIVRVGLNYKFGNYYAPVVTK
jgi:outer membrane immunogenic protein